MAVVIVLPFLVLLGIQTWRIAAGEGVSPPSTVTRFPDLVSYYIVQVIILVFALGAADQIRLRRVRASSSASMPGDNRRLTAVGLVVNGVLSAVVASAFRLDRPLFDPGSVVHHSSNGSPPWLGVLGIGLSGVVFLVLGLMTLVRSRRATSGVGATAGNRETMGHAG